jgi:hypothetical protein
MRAIVVGAIHTQIWRGDQRVLKFWRPFLWAALAVCFLSFVAWLATFTGSYEACHAQNQAADTHDEPQKSKKWAFLQCEGEVVDSNNGTIAALATIFIAAFTLTLWRATDKLWKAGEKQIALGEKTANAAITAADAASRQATSMVAIELPIFVIEDVRILEDHPRGVEIKLGNHGRTPAIITAHCLETNVAKTLPKKTGYTRDGTFEVLRDQVVDRGHSYSIVRAIIPLDDDEWGLILRGATTLWAFGYVDYLDFMKREHREGYCIAFLPVPVTLAERAYPSMGTFSLNWVRTGNPGYAYNRYKTDEERRGGLVEPT